MVTNQSDKAVQLEKISQLNERVELAFAQQIEWMSKTELVVQERVEAHLKAYEDKYRRLTRMAFQRLNISSSETAVQGLHRAESAPSSLHA